MADELPELMVDDATAWRGWLVLAKKGNTTPTSLSYAQALDEALCQGWIDGQVQRRDEFSYRQRFTPRRNRSRWSQSNIGNVSRLTKEGRMQRTGVATVARARADGSWEGAALFRVGQGGSGRPRGSAGSRLPSSVHVRAPDDPRP